eukprot:SAG31_NODE_43518_length_266_cov_8.700599_1_plen_84_part_10
MQKRIKAVREWASKKLVFTNDDYMFSSDVREYFERDSGASIPERTSFFHGIQAAARLQGFRGEVRGEMHDRKARRGRIYFCQWA